MNFETGQTQSDSIIFMDSISHCNHGSEARNYDTFETKFSSNAMHILVNNYDDVII